VNLPAGLIGVQVAGVNGDVGHALPKQRDTIGEGTRSSVGSATARERIARSNNDLIIYLSIILPPYHHQPSTFMKSNLLVF
jgi:hypothetical protein